MVEIIIIGFVQHCCLFYFLDVLMMHKSRFFHIIGFIIFFVGALIGMVWLTGVAWANLEVLPYRPNKLDNNLSTLVCSLMITKEEQASIKVTLANPLKQNLHRTASLRLGAPTSDHLSFVDVGVFDLEPGQRKTQLWRVTPDALMIEQKVIIATVAVSRALELPGLHGSCGVLVLPFSHLRGFVALILCNLLSAGAIIFGLYLRRKQVRNPGLSYDGSLLAVAGFYAIGAISVLWLHWWAVGAAMVLVMIMMMLMVVADALWHT